MFYNLELLDDSNYEVKESYKFDNKTDLVRRMYHVLLEEIDFRLYTRNPGVHDWRPASLTELVDVVRGR